MMDNRKIKYGHLVLVALVLSFIGYYLLNPRVSRLEKQKDRMVDYDDVDSLLNTNSRLLDTIIMELNSRGSKPIGKKDLGDLYFYKLKKAVKDRDFDSIPFFIEKGLYEAESLENKYLLYHIKKAEGNYFLHISQYVKSLEAFYEALQYNVENDEVRNAQVYMGIAGIYYYLDDLEQAIYFCELAFSVFKKYDIKSGLASYYGNMAGIYTAKGEDEKTIDFTKRSLEISQEIEDSLMTAVNLSSLGTLALKKGDVEEALSYLDLAYPIAVNINNSNLISDVLCGYGEVYEQIGELDKAEKYYLEANSLSKNTSSRTKMIRLNGLARVAELNGEFQNSNRYLKEYYVLNEEIKGAGVSQSVEKIRWKSLLREKEFEQQLVNEKFKFRTVLYSATMLIAFLLIALFYYRYKNKSNSLKLYLAENKSLEEIIEVEKELKKIQDQVHHAELETLSKELTSLNIMMLTKNNFVSDLKEIILTSKNDANPSNVLSKIKHAVSRLSNVEQDWEQFQHVFQQVHPDFFNSIKSKFPLITKGELRICAYIKINMSNNEIASLLNVEQRSVITNRYRIRKKMNLDSEINLDNYIQSL